MQRQKLNNCSSFEQEMTSHLGGQSPLIDAEVPPTLPEGHKLNKEQFQLVDNLLLSYLKNCKLYVSSEETRKKKPFLGTWSL